MERRQLIVGIGSCSALTLAGCVGDVEEPDEDGAGAAAEEGDDDTDQTSGGDTAETDDGGEPGDDATEKRADDSTGDDVLYAVSVSLAEESPAEDLPLAVTWDVHHEEITDGDPFAIEFTLQNEGEESIEVFSGAPWPFGVIRIEKIEENTRSVVLWTEGYEETGYVRTEGYGVTEIDDLELGETLPAGEAVTETYELHADTPDLSEGMYEFVLNLIAEAGDISDSISLGFELQLSE